MPETAPDRAAPAVGAEPSPASAPAFRRALGEVFGIDLASLAAFRVALGVALVGDLLDRSRHLTLLYTDAGVLPRPLAVQFFTTEFYLSLHLLSGLAAVQVVLFSVAGLLAFAMVVGYRTRLATILSWVLLVSLQTRNWTVLHGGDALLRMLAFWAMFLPLGARYSVDALLSGHPARDARARFLSVAGAGLLLQVCFTYWFALALRTSPVWWRGEALYYAFSIDSIVKPLGHALIGYPWAMKALTYGTLALEIGGTLAVLSPFGTRTLRRLVVPGFVFLHLGIAATMQIGIFPWVSTAGWMVFVPGDVWDRAAARGAKIFRAPLGALAAWLAPAVGAVSSTTRTELRASRVNQILSAFFLVYVTGWNLAGLEYLDLARFFPRSLVWIGQMLQVEQRWNLFAPYPITKDGWFVVPGALENGAWVDLFRGGAPGTWDKPASLTDLYGDARWWMFTHQMLTFDAAKYGYASHLCRTWNLAHPKGSRLVGLQIYFVHQETLPSFQKGPPERTGLWEHRCF